MFLKIPWLTKMRKVGYLLMLMMLSPVSSYCPQEKTHSLGRCAYHIECMENIRGIHLHNECLESANYPVTVDLKLTNAVERFDYRIEQDFLGFITSLTISADWAETSLSLLQYTTRLQKLILSSNNIEKITGKPFYFLSNLESLDLSNNQLTNVDELFQFELHPNKLFKLSLAYNRIEELPGDVFEELTSLIELDLSYNKITNINEEPFSNLTSLETLRLNNNLIKNLNGAVNNLHILKNLYLRDNQIQNIDVQSLKIITHLETFDVSRNQLEKINSIVFLRHWKHLGGKKICKIILSDNHINVLPNTSKEISARYTRSARPYSVDVLTEVDLSNNEISDIEYNAFQSLFKMISLDLSRNKIIDFVVNADDLEHVKYLNLSGNYIVRLYFESFSAMKNLQNLDLSHNYLDYIPDQTFTNTYNLKNVNMTYNEIAIIKNCT
ncbi:chaoptin-like [Manduca sexta]|uniref:chaoptin-like n=1 Tax=Manduca sexta TaxID=7130 RepID=UPI00188F4F39|nr:chaoptin-like [Manduca sexta]